MRKSEKTPSGYKSNLGNPAALLLADKDIVVSGAKILGIVLGVAVVGVGGFFAYRAIKRKVQDNRSRNTGKQVDQNTPSGRAVKYAQRIYGALITNPWLNDSIGDGTNLTELYKVGELLGKDQAVTFAMVSNAYRKLYKGRNITDDLKGDLNSTETVKWTNLINGNSLSGLL